MISILIWFMGTRTGRIMGAITAALAAFFIAVFKAFSVGKAAEKLEQNKASLGAYKTREHIDDDVAKMDETCARDELSRWMQHESDAP